MLCFRCAFFALNEWVARLSNNPNRTRLTGNTYNFCTELFSINLNFFFIPGVIKIPTEILRIQLVLKGSGVADERLNIHFTIFITGNLRIKK
jgi:hypothetical protein